MSLTRSENMARIRAENTSPERILQAALAQAGLTPAPHARTPVGRPDLVLLEPPVALFIDGCFWHGCPEHYVRPRSREDFWSAKLEENVVRDRRQTQALEAAGWQVIRVWEHEVFEALDEVQERILRQVAGHASSTTGPAWRVLRVEVVDPTNDLERRCMVDLSEPPLTQEVVQKRTTRKWKKPKGWKEIEAPPQATGGQPIGMTTPETEEGR